MVPAGWDAHDGIPGDHWPAAVVFDCDVKRHGFFLAGYYRAAGVPVVFVSDSRGYATRRYAAKSGCYVVFGAGGFARWLATDPPYLNGVPPCLDV